MTTRKGPKPFLPFLAVNTYAPDVARAGVKVHHNTAGSVHAKTTVCADGELSSIGSATKDIRSFSINHESTALIYVRAVAQQRVAAFEHDLGGCVPFDVSRYRSPGPLPRFRNSIARLASPLL